MKILAISATHDFSICLYDSYKNYFCYTKEERLSGIKHDPLFDNVKKYLENICFIPDLIVFPYGDVEKTFIEKELSLYSKVYKNIFELQNYLLNLKKTYKKKFPDSDSQVFGQINGVKNDSNFIIGFNHSKNFIIKLNFTNTPVQWIHHDYAHILSGWCLKKEIFNCEYGISLDGGGPDHNNKLVLSNPFDLKKVKVLYSSRRVKIENGKSVPVLNSLGSSLVEIGKKMSLNGQGLDFAGKIMGLQAYGEVNYNILDQCNYDELLNSNIHSFFREKLDQFEGSPIYKNKSFVDLVSTLHKIWERSVVHLFKKFIKNKYSKIVYSGGCAQNSVTNRSLFDLYPNLEIVPHCYDGGLCLGCLAFAVIENNLEFPIIKFPYIQNDFYVEEPDYFTIREIAKCLSEGKIVGWYQGNGEVGPRALGNRSILMNPSIKEGKNILNSKVKHREHWRPYAPSVLEEFVLDWFDVSESKYMMIAAKVKNDKKNIISAVVHEDNTSRIQTVNINDNKIFYSLIKEFYKITKIPMILNTSLNEGGGPIVGNPTQAKNIFQNSDLDILCIGNKIYKKGKSFL